jgi:hypothetical protein
MNDRREKRRRWWIYLLALGITGSLLAAEPPIDWAKARQLRQRVMRGEKLTPEEQAYYDRAVTAYQGGQRATAPQVNIAPWTNHLTPLTELGTGTYKGQLGGLYGGGQNGPPATHADAARKAMGQIRPLDAGGQPTPSGKIVLLSVGMSNTTMEFSRFEEEADRDPRKSSKVEIVDGAQSGQTATIWSNPRAPVWGELSNRLAQAHVTTQQVQAVWIKQAEGGPSRLGEFPHHVDILKRHLATTVNLLKQRFPNLRVAYLSSRIYAGYATTPLNPEPYAYETAFAVRGLIEDQIAGRTNLNYAIERGPIKAPVLLWGPYLWADGQTPRRSDGLVWTRADFADRDGTHPSESGREKVAQILLKFFATDPVAQGWFTTDRTSP